MRVWQTGSTPFGAGSIGFDAADSGVAELGHIVEHDWLRLGLWQRPGGSGRRVGHAAHGRAARGLHTGARRR